jgi:uncharacterized protein YndB with AHSA1/START domain
MTDVTTVPPVRKQLTVEARQEVAFEVFTRRMGSWWNPAHRLGTAPLADVVIEPREDGRWFELDTDGTECDWGRVLAWEPPDRVLLGWQLDGEWDFDPDFLTELEIRFVAVGPRTTRVELEHRNLDAYGADAVDVRASLDSPNGWPGLLDRFAAGVAG